MEVLDELQDSYEQYLIQKTEKLRIPLGATFELSPLCNFRCRMCYVEQKSKEVEAAGGLKPLSFWKDIARQAVEEGCLYVLLTGGEPLLYPDFKALYRYLKQLGMYIIINTNGSLLTPEMIDMLGEDPPKRLNISLYGASTETYERLCSNGNMFQKVMGNLEYLQNYNSKRAEGLSEEQIYQKQPGIPFRLHTVLTPDNYGDYDAIVDIANRLKVPLSFVTYIFPSVRKGDPTLNLNARFDACKAGCNKFRYMTDSHEGSFENYIKNVHRQYTDYKNYPYFGVESVACRGGINTFWVNWKGEMSGCGMLPGPWFDLTTESFKSAWEAVKQATDALRINSECAVCPKRSVCPVCVASAHAETGDYSGKPEYLCAMTEQFVKMVEEQYQNLNPLE